MSRQPDHFAKKAKSENYAARSIYKLQEIQKKYKLIKKNAKVIDLGCAPGSWLQYIRKIIGHNGFLLGYDIQDINITTQNNVVVKIENILKIPSIEIKNEFGMFDGVVSDMAPKTTGVKDRDHFASMELCEKAFEVAKKTLKQNGFFVCKMFDGEDSPDFIKKVRRYFNFFKAIRPKATKKQSREVFLVGSSFKTNIN